MSAPAHSLLRVVTWNIHKGVRGVGPRRRLEIHNMQKAVAGLDADIICLQEVRRVNEKEAARFAHWPHLPQADFLSPEGYAAVYQTNAYTQHGEHGNAVLARHPVRAFVHQDMSDHRFEQRGLLHVTLDVRGQPIHVIVVHLGLIAASRTRQMKQLGEYIASAFCAKQTVIVAGDFNASTTALRWAQAVLGGGGALPPQRKFGVPAWHALRAHATFPSALPMVQLDHVFARHARVVSMSVPQGRAWARMSDHLPLVVELEL